jgi:hypothetical protein
MTYSFGQGPGGLSGNDDSGALSAWYVWNAIGIFPIVGQDIYFIGSPIFPETTISIGSKPFRISAPETSDANRYVIGAKLNGKPLRRGYLRYAEIAQGGELELTMAAKPGTWPNELPLNTKPVSYHEPTKSSTLMGSSQTWSWSLDGKSWTEGPAPLGYGDRHIRTKITEGGKKPLCAFFKKTFSVDDPAGIERLFFDVMVDDGCVIKLNGHEVVRYNMPEGAITDKSLATHGVVSQKEQAFFPYSVDVTTLKKGTNLIEVRVHQNGVHSSDLGFDLSVRVEK